MIGDNTRFFRSMSDFITSSPIHTSARIAVIMYGISSSMEEHHVNELYKKFTWANPGTTVTIRSVPRNFDGLFSLIRWSNIVLFHTGSLMSSQETLGRILKDHIKQFSFDISSKLIVGTKHGIELISEKYFSNTTMRFEKGLGLVRNLYLFIDYEAKLNYELNVMFNKFNGYFIIIPKNQFLYMDNG